VAKRKSKPKEKRAVKPFSFVYPLAKCPRPAYLRPFQQPIFDMEVIDRKSVV
jgi:hypothetical protein